MGGSWVLFFISDNQEIQHGSPGVLGLIFYNGQPRIRVAVLGLIFYNGRPKNSNMRVQCTGFYFLYQTIKMSNMGGQVYWVLFFITDTKNSNGSHVVLDFFSHS